MRWHLAMTDTAAEEASDLRSQLQQAAPTEEIVSRWINAPMEGNLSETAIGRMEDIAKSEGVIVIPHHSGETEAELGLGVAFNKRVVLIGERELPMHYLPGIDVYPTFESFLEDMA